MSAAAVLVLVVVSEVVGSSSALSSASESGSSEVGVGEGSSSGATVSHHTYCQSGVEDTSTSMVLDLRDPCIHRYSPKVP